MTFFDELVRQGLIDEQKKLSVFKIAEDEFEGDIDKALIKSGVDKDKLLDVKSTYYNMPVRSVESDDISFETLKYIPEESARHYDFVPLGLVNDTLEVGIVDPSNIKALDALQFISTKNGIPFKTFLITQEDFDTVMKGYEGMSSRVDEALSELDQEISDATGDVLIQKNENKELSAEEEERIVEEAPIIKIVAVILRHATEAKASDIHIEGTAEKVKVRFRIDGDLETNLTLPLGVYSGVVARIKILAKLRLDEKRKPQDGGFSAQINSRRIDFRVSSFPTKYGEKVVIRILDVETGVRDLSELGLSERNKKIIKKALEKTYGIVLITGPTGSGKSTTLYSMLNELDREKKNVVSLENPIEYDIQGVSQSQVAPEIGYTFATGLRSILRQDPDVIMVGEIRDKETAQLAIQAALTGHLVFSTLHTNNAIGVVPRLVDMGVDPYLIAPTLNLAIAQRLVRVICDDAKKEVPIKTEVKQMMDSQFKDLPESVKGEIPSIDKMYELNPNEKCPSGTKGRVAVFEMFANDSEMKDVILKDPTEGSIYGVARKEGMFTMKEDAIIKHLKGQIPIQDVYGL